MTVGHFLKVKSNNLIYYKLHLVTYLYNKGSILFDLFKWKENNNLINQISDRKREFTNQNIKIISVLPDSNEHYNNGCILVWLLIDKSGTKTVN